MTVVCKSSKLCVTIRRGGLLLIVLVCVSVGIRYRSSTGQEKIQVSNRRLVRASPHSQTFPEFDDNGRRSDKFPGFLLSTPQRRRLRGGRNYNRVCQEHSSLNGRVRRAEIIFFGKIEWFADGLSRRENKLGKGVVGGVKVGNVLKGPTRLRGKRLVIGGFGRHIFCVSKGQLNGTRIFFVVLDRKRRLQLSASLLRVQYLKEVAAAVAKG